MGSIINDTSAVKAVEQDDLVMPVIDFSAFVNGSPTERQQTASQILHAFKTSGFLYLSNHPIPASTVTRAFELSAKFFARPQHQKDALAWSTPQANRGYVASGREKTTTLTDINEIAKLRDQNPDLKETMEIGRENVPGHPNQWPDRFDTNDNEGATFTTFMQTLHNQLTQLHTQVMRAIGIALMGAPGESYFDDYTDAGDNTLRLLHYPAVPRSVFAQNPNQVRTGAHSDYGSVTLLFQDAVGGLQVLSPRGTWVRAAPIPGTVVVNAGDLLARWSNDVIVSTKHRVVQPPPPPPSTSTSTSTSDGLKATNKNEDASKEEEEAMYPARYSMAFFCNPNFSRYIEALPGTFGGALGEKKYEGINSGDYLVQRLTATY